MTRTETLVNDLKAALGGRLVACTVALGEVTIVCNSDAHFAAAQILRDDERLAFAQCIDLCGVDYSSYGEGAWHGSRFAVVLHLLSIKHNWRVRLRTFCPDEDLPLLASVTPIWRAIACTRAARAPARSDCAVRRRRTRSTTTACPTWSIT